MDTSNLFVKAGTLGLMVASVTKGRTQKLARKFKIVKTY
jgi:hypothetical protein